MEQFIANVGRPLIVLADLDEQNDALLRSFENRMAAEDDVMACYEMSEEFNFLLAINSASMKSYQAFTREVFSSANNLRNFKRTHGPSLNGKVKQP